MVDFKTVAWATSFDSGKQKFAIFPTLVHPVRAALTQYIDCEYQYA